ncbi:GGDEF domain-containing protein [Marinomonas sp. 2405UD68-3]|uniref:GGDEF domain-containing protein n=1 Tax=Marinomonas sp. 2405UD68-3 TaxID=3391835 RepID=UPI0039C9F488
MLKVLTHYFKAIVHNYAFCGLSGDDLSEQSRKVLLINLFCFVGVLFTLPLGLIAIVNQDVWVASSTLFISSLYTLNHVYLRFTLNYEVSSNVILYPLFILMLFLVFSGGVNQTGFVWIYCIPPVAMFLHGLKRGMIEIVLFLCVLLLIFLFPSELGATYNWSQELKKRIVYSFLVLGFLSAVYEYSRMKSISMLRNLSEELQVASKTDPLTTLLNRRGMLEVINKESSNDKQVFDNALIICDVDFFKKVNDKYGHNIGDAVLIELSNIFKENWGKDAHISRWGGEEFLIFIPSTLFDIIHPEVERFRKRIEKVRFGDLDNPFHVTLSFGIARFNYQESIDNAINRADKHLYKAKSNGRNCIVSD